MIISIHGKDYNVSEEDFPIMSDDDNWEPLKIRKGIGQLDKEIGFLRDVSEILANKTITVIGDGNRGYVPINLLDTYRKIYFNTYDDFTKQNIHRHDGDCKIYFNTELKVDVAYVNSGCATISLSDIPIVISDLPNQCPNNRRFKFNNRYVFVHPSAWPEFYTKFRYYISGDNLNYNNLINLLIMVKNGGDSLRNVLEKNLPFVDRWTFLDTGSTDNTINVIRDVMKDKKGMIYQEPFINFRDSRNRLLQLAGDSCAFNVMLDDTYIIRGDLRQFLDFVRSDDVADSFSMNIKQIDLIYSSTRITKSRLGLRYVHLVHEIIEDNMSVLIPEKRAYIEDITSPYMKERTLSRKVKDLKWLQTEIDEVPDDPRQFYYMGETYLCLKDYVKAYEWYVKRYQHPVEGYKEERYDAIYKSAVLADVFLSHSWEIVQQRYLDAFIYDSNRPEAMFQLGIHYKNINRELAYMFFKKAFDIGMPPPDYGMNIKIEMYNYHLPKNLAPLCLEFRDYKTGESACRKANEYFCSTMNASDTFISYWLSIFYLLNQNEKFRGVNKLPLEPVDKETIVFLIAGGWSEWYGKTLYEKGLGGSETCVVRFSEQLASDYNVLVFCNCGSEVLVWNNVKYVPISKYVEYVSTIKIKVAFVNRYPEYLPVTLVNKVNCYLMLHDLTRQNDTIPVENEYLQGVLCLSNWHKKYVDKAFPDASVKTSVISYGIDVDSFPILSKKKHSFIYPSFPNRGLIHLLDMFPRITTRYPDATLDIFVNFEIDWVKNNLGEQKINEMKMSIDKQPNVINHGWVNGETLRRYWSQSHVWFYPCDFKETCCLVGYEAACSKTLAITSDLAALSETVGDRGLIVSGTPSSEEWREKAFEVLCDALNGKIDVKTLLETNYEWAKTKSYENVVTDFENEYILV